MRTRIASLVLSTMLLAAGCGAALWTWHLVQGVETLQQTGNQTSLRIDRVSDLLDEIADEELRYAASGLAEDQTLTAAAALVQQASSESAGLVAHSLSAASPAAAAVRDASGTLAEIDRRGRENLAAGLALTAADLLFTESHAIRTTMRQQLRALRAAEADTVEQARAGVLRQAWLAFAGVALLVALALIRWPRRETLTSPLPNADAATREEPETPGSILAPADAVVPAPAPAAVDGVDLAETASLCTAIGRLHTQTDLPDLLSRTASVVDATGVVIWMAAGEELFPAAVHGYDLMELNRVGPIPRAAGNATAAAWRSETLQTVAGDTSSRSAMVAPMLGSDRCIGVLALEVAPGRERDISLQAVAKLVAAQLAAVLAAWPAASSAPADVIPFERAASN